MQSKSFQKFLTIIISLVLIFTVVGCSVVEEESSNSTSTSSQLSNSTLETSSTSSDKSSSSEESSSTHTCVFDQKIVSEEYLVSEATYLDGGVYHLSCECGESGDETFETTVLDYQYENIEHYINMILTNGSYKNPFWNTEKSGYATWNYIDGCMMTSFYKLYGLTKDEKYWDFVNAYMNYLVKDSGSMEGYSTSEYNLDNINEGRVLFLMYEKKGSEKYKLAIDKLYAQLENQPRTSAAEPKGNFWHKNKYKQQIWLDGIYMAQPFYATYIKTYGTEEGKTPDYSDIISQISNVEKYMKDKDTGLYYHGIDVSKAQSWADKETGLSSSFWGRAMGWYFAALSDLTEIIDKKTNPEDWATIQGYFKKAVDDLLPFMDDETHMFYQVLDKGDTKDKNGKSNYLETSASSLFAYAILHGVNTGALDESYFNIGKSIFNGICINKFEVNPDADFENGDFKTSDFKLKDICKVAGLSSDRNGSFEYYLSESIVSNEAKGVAPFLMAYVEILGHEAK